MTMTMIRSRGRYILELKRSSATQDSHNTDFKCCANNYGQLVKLIVADAKTRKAATLRQAWFAAVGQFTGSRSCLNAPSGACLHSR